MSYIKKFFSYLYYAFFIEGDTLANKKEETESTPTETQTETSGEEDERI